MHLSRWASCTTVNAVWGSEGNASFAAGCDVAEKLAGMDSSKLRRDDVEQAGCRAGPANQRDSLRGRPVAGRAKCF